MKYTVVPLVKSDGMPTTLEKVLNSLPNGRLVSIQKAPVYFDGANQPKEQWVAIIELDS